ncbi:hypothetical protein [Aquimarina sp. AU474]|uniref:hypothetical protein n=1 Tax=Aquimarina sp. AU474 TaxID=2108529 RepID=UPI000D6895DA|nr:hypothetical protein [Aquimarina sp. AU474]
MKKIEGLYRINNPHTANEKHGGKTIMKEVYWYLAFYDNDYRVGLYGSTNNDYSRFISEKFELGGNYILDDDKIEFKIENPYTNETIGFKGVISKDKNEIAIQGIKESDNEQKWIDDTFKKIELDDIS